MPTLPMSCRGGAAHDDLEALACERRAVVGVPGQMVGEKLDEGLRAQDVVAGFDVAHFGKAGERGEAEVADQRVLVRAAGDFAFEPCVLVVQALARLGKLDVGAYPCKHDVGIERLGDVIHRAEGEAVRLALHRVHRGDEDDRDVARRRVGLEGLQHLVAVHVRHHDVEQDHVGQRADGDRMQCALSRDGGADTIVRAQRLAEDGEVLGRVIDDEDGASCAAVGGHGLDSAGSAWPIVLGSGSRVPAPKYQ